MNVKELIDVIAGHVDSGQATTVPVLVRCDGVLREIEAVETRPTADESRRPRDVFVLIVADGPTDVSEASAITTRSPRG